MEMEMSPETVAALADAIVRQTIFSNWQLYALMIALAAVGAAAGAGIVGFFKKKAEQAAIAADFGKILAQLKQTTDATESVKLNLQYLTARSQKLEQLKSEKLERYLECIYMAVEYLNQVKDHHYFGGGVQEKLGLDPFTTASMLQSMYLSELDAEHNGFRLGVVRFREWVVDGMKLQKVEEINGAIVKRPPPTDHLDKYSDAIKELHAPLLVLDAAVTKLSRSLHDAKK
jgi:hypothetical protein